MSVGEHRVLVTDAASFATAFDVSRETSERLETYAALLRRWQKTVNLVAPSTLDEIWHRHFADSAQLRDLAPNTARRWLDLGSGAGFPGLVLALLLRDRPDAQVILIESDSRKVAFLHEAARQMRLAVDIICERIENVATQGRLGCADVITARAIAPLPRLLSLASPFFGDKTKGLFLKGRSWKDEVEAARRTWRFQLRVIASRTDVEGRVIEISNLEAKPED